MVMAKSTAVLAAVCLALAAKVNAQTPFVGEVRATVSRVGPATLSDFYLFVEQDESAAQAPAASDAATSEGDTNFKGKCLEASFDDKNIASGAIAFADCDGTDQQMWQALGTAATKVQWRNRKTLTCMTLGTENEAPITLQTCDAGNRNPSQQFLKSALISSGPQYQCGGPCTDNDGLCAFSSEGQDWCENVGVIHNNKKVATQKFCGSPAGAGVWKVLSSSPCSKACGGGTTQISYSCTSVLGFPNACCGTLPASKQACNSFPCGSTAKTSQVVVATEVGGQASSGKCLTAVNGDVFQFDACNGWTTQMFVPIASASPDRKLWVNLGTGNCLTIPSVFTGTDKDRLLSQACSKTDVNQQFDAAGPLVDSKSNTCPAPCSDQSNLACAFRDTDIASADWCKAGSFGLKRMNTKVDHSLWCTQPASKGEWTPVGQTECSVSCGGGVQKASGYKCTLASNPKSTGTACCGKKPTAASVSCNPQPCGRPTQ